MRTMFAFHCRIIVAAASNLLPMMEYYAWKLIIGGVDELLCFGKHAIASSATKHALIQ